MTVRLQTCDANIETFLFFLLFWVGCMITLKSFEILSAQNEDYVNHILRHVIVSQSTIQNLIRLICKRSKLSSIGTSQIFENGDSNMHMHVYPNEIKKNEDDWYFMKFYFIDISFFEFFF